MRFLRNALALLCAFILIFLGTPLVQWSTQALAAPWGREDAPVLVVLGGDMLIPGTGTNATLGFDTYLRCVMASLLARQHSYQYIVVTGAWGLSNAMQRFLVSQGVNPAQVLQENAAQSTYQNAVFTKRILTSVYGAQLPAVVVLTSDFHSRRALLTFQHAGFHATAIPAPDVLKRCGNTSYRLQAAETIAIELVALAAYKMKGYA